MEDIVDLLRNNNYIVAEGVCNTKNLIDLVSDNKKNKGNKMNEVNSELAPTVEQTEDGRKLELTKTEDGYAFQTKEDEGTDELVA